MGFNSGLKELRHIWAADWQLSPRPAVGRTYEPLLIFSFFFFFGVSGRFWAVASTYRGFEIYPNAQPPTWREFDIEQAAW
jgi:hypothetical protein